MTGIVNRVDEETEAELKTGIGKGAGLSYESRQQALQAAESLRRSILLLRRHMNTGADLFDFEGVIGPSRKSTKLHLTRSK